MLSAEVDVMGDGEDSLVLAYEVIDNFPYQFNAGMILPGGGFV